MDTKTRVTLKIKSKEEILYTCPHNFKVNGKTYYSKWSKIKSVKTK